MRLTLIRVDGFIVIDGTKHIVDLSSIDQSIHAIQWYDDQGEIEYADSRGRIVENVKITSLDNFQYVISLWQEKQQEQQLLQIPVLDETINL